MALLPKDYLSIDDVADYFNNLGHDYDLSVSSDSYKIRKDIYDLILQEKIIAVFNFFDTYNFKSAYYFVGRDKARKILIENDSYINIKGFNGIYCYADGSRPNSNDISSFTVAGNNVYDITEDHYICLDDIYIPIKELDALFNSNAEQSNNLSKHIDKIPAPTVTQTEPPNNNQLIKELAAAKAKITDLESQLTQTKAELTYKPADGDKDLNTKSQNYAAKIVLAMAQIADLSLDTPYASKEPNTTNSIIFDQIKINGMKVSNQVIGNWLKLATEQTKDD